MDLDFSKMSSTTIFSIALLAALVILLIVLVIVTIKVLSKGKKEEKEYMERRYTTRESKKKDGEDREDQEDGEDGEAEEEKKDKRKKKDSKNSKDSSDKASEASKDSKEDEEDDEDEEEDDEDENEESEEFEESDEDEDKPEVKDEVAAVVEAALQAKAKAAELEARVAKEKAERAAEEAAIAAEKASQAEAEAQAATRKVTPISMQDRLRKKQEEDIPVEVTEPTEKMPALDEELSEAQKNVKDTAEVAEVAEVAEEDFDDEDYDDEVTEDTDEIPVARINRELKKQAAETEDKQVDPDVLKATTKVADAQEIISAVKKAKGRKPAEGDSAFGENAFPVDGEVKDESKKKLETSFDSAFTDVQLHQEIEGRKDELTDSAFGVQEPIQEEEIKPLQVASETITVNPVNAVNIPTVNAVAPVETKNPEAGIESATDMKEFLTENPVPKKSKKKIKKKDAAFAKKFDSDAPKLKTAEYFWYNNQDIEALTKKEDMYFYCHYFHDPAKAVLPLIIEMYDCAFVRTEELQKIAYGIQYKSMGLREILTAKDNVSFDRSRITKEPTDKDMLQIRAKWCDYVDKFLQIIVIQAPEDVQEYLRNQLYSYGENDVDTLLFCPEPEDEEE